MRIGIIGSRRRNSQEDKIFLESALLHVIAHHPMEIREQVIVVSGGCPKGGDRFAEELASKYNLPTIIHLPDKSRLPENPQRWHFAEINFARNQWIARDSDVLIALVAHDRTGGTENTIKHFLTTYKKPVQNLIILSDMANSNEGSFNL